ncbi:FAD-dependent oxidoreductase [Fluviispira vulneris]|uniref:FAD-dependent oxidoreductase n=1 Tax=Fluviispira vulneris TaxID=2763012 RepID=UPI001646A4AD|nr:FAD-dependent oxidoreductase [Fluviispira vulneris]
MRVGIIGAGILGRLIAIELFKRKYKVTIFEKSDANSSGSCTTTAAGMLAPWSESYESSQLVFELGVTSLKLWPNILKTLNSTHLFKRQGTAHLTLYRERHKLEHFFEHLKKRNIHFEAIKINSENKKEFVGEFSQEYSFGYYFPQEATLNPMEFILKCNDFFKENKISFNYNHIVTFYENNKITTDQGDFYFDSVINTMGLGAKNVFEKSKESLRGVRGSLVLVHAPLVNIHSVIRLTHLRYPIYIVPRGNNKYIIGATSHETECLKPITVESLLELLSVAAHFDKGFLEANLLDQRVNLRPTFMDGSPHFYSQNGIHYINGLHRNGITISPALANIFCNYLERKSNNNLDFPIENNKIMEELCLNY